MSETTNQTVDLDRHAPGGKYLLVRSGSEQYGLPVGFVERVREYDPLTDVPESSPGLRGAMNLQGEVVPVLDLQVLLSLGETTPDDRTCIVVVTVEETTFGLLVDRLHNVKAIEEDQLSSEGEGGPEEDNPFVRGVILRNDRPVFLLDLPGILNERSIHGEGEHHGNSREPTA